MERLRKSDIDKARALITQEFRELGPKLAITQELIHMFAKATQDFNPVHVDPDLASAGKTIAHGFLPVASIPSLVSDLDPFGLFIDARCILKKAEIEFMLPVRVGSEVFCRSRVASVEPAGANLLVRFEWKIMIEHHTAAAGAFMLLYR